jgi:hypothetical protein
MSCETFGVPVRSGCLDEVLPRPAGRRKRAVRRPAKAQPAPTPAPAPTAPAVRAPALPPVKLPPQVTDLLDSLLRP